MWRDTTPMDGARLPGEYDGGRLTGAVAIVIGVVVAAVVVGALVIIAATGGATG